MLEFDIMETIFDKSQSAIEEGMNLAKCRQCGCMKDTLDNLSASLESTSPEGSNDFLQKLKTWQQRLEPIKYSCLGCERCFPGEATNILDSNLPGGLEVRDLECPFNATNQVWPVVPGEYFVPCTNSRRPVAVSTLASSDLASELSNLSPDGLAIVGKTETENIGIDKVIKNIITNQAIHFLILAGKESEGHFSGRTLLALWENGVDENLRVINSPGKRPLLRNVTIEEIRVFRSQVDLVDLIGCDDKDLIAEKIKTLSKIPITDNSVENLDISTSPTIQATQTDKIELDEEGYFVIIPQIATGKILAEHYSYDDKLMRTIKGNDAISVYQTIIRNGWIGQLSHSAYIGRELTKAELSMKFGFKYTQDGIFGAHSKPDTADH